ncbi:MAG: 5'/3'-nucleotidase SurE [Planctomycetia bacterium]|uniref:5'-nucleotidase SurE n=1 Tax=Candidatus Brocadia sapporoensis TaxID=392547 RepID=A0A1V6M0Q2_9BACT|nr:5'/3'-nucleotidase SurE [Candidatus Brocadia sapporoensis]MCC7239143.1 5'/3'-nucleotidase SurE [Candidatus Brocadia sp.]QOJ06563.1 MAG: 5'/3'-nucleotidase SurE [Planctomycetia bacterium]TVL95022.1 MAG: 5'/3'-nucleotidase SurE [Candidatus Brocadia sp. BL1]MDG6006458.1 5'/3'-nucleotidase SurE [Candidatus Brocadia sp.]OQD45947.1 5'/3'-nucleotidase SurE [Candidatus Brocadia sapporoensis]
MQILLTNDDGIYAPGIAALKQNIQDLGHVTVVAPDVEQSGVGHSITFSHPLRIREAHLDNEFIGYSVNGSPADCVKLAIYEAMKNKPDVVISGINMGTNVGIHILYSGTVAAAVEAAIMGYPSIAISFEISGRYDDIHSAAKVARDIIKRIITHKLPKGSLLNVNIPSIPPDQIKGIKVTRQFAHDFKENFEKRIDPGGKAYYWLLGTDKRLHREEETDIHAVNEGYISITPLLYDLTDYTMQKKILDWDWKGIVS